jgi:hypothetical protein
MMKVNKGKRRVAKVRNGILGPLEKPPPEKLALTVINTGPNAQTPRSMKTASRELPSGCPLSR